MDGAGKFLAPLGEFGDSVAAMNPDLFAFISINDFSSVANERTKNVNDDLVAGSYRLTFLRKGKIVKIFEEGEDGHLLLLLGLDPSVDLIERYIRVRPISVVEKGGERFVQHRLLVLKEALKKEILLEGNGFNREVAELAKVLKNKRAQPVGVGKSFLVLSFGTELPALNSGREKSGVILRALNGEPMVSQRMVSSTIGGSNQVGKLVGRKTLMKHLQRFAGSNRVMKGEGGEVRSKGKGSGDARLSRERRFIDSGLRNGR